MGYKTNKKTPITRHRIISIAFMLSLFWIFLSSVADLSPIRTLSGVKNLFSKETSTEGMNRTQLLKKIKEQDKMIENLQNQLNNISKASHITARIAIEDTDLNFRSLPTTNSLILEKLSAGTQVLILDSLQHIDTLHGIGNRWYKVEYDQLTGWVWGQYLDR